MKPANKEKLTALISAEKTNTAERNKARIRNRETLRESRIIAMKIHDRLDELGWTKKLLADKMGVAPQQVTKFLSGKENITLKTMVALQKALGISILATHEKAEKEKIINVVIEIKKIIVKPIEDSLWAYQATFAVPKKRPRKYKNARVQCFQPIQTNA